MPTLGPGRAPVVPTTEAAEPRARTELGTTAEVARGCTTAPAGGAATRAAGAASRASGAAQARTRRQALDGEGREPRDMVDLRVSSSGDSGARNPIGSPAGPGRAPGGLSYGRDHDHSVCPEPPRPRPPPPMTPPPDPYAPFESLRVEHHDPG